MSRRTALILDLLLVVVFAIIGRLSHDESAAPVGTAQTAWPFLVGTLVGWAVVQLIGRSRPAADAGADDGLRTGLVVWVATVGGGIGLRLASGDTAQLPFIIVATIVLGLFLNGWRLISRLTRRHRPSK